MTTTTEAAKTRDEIRTERDEGRDKGRNERVGKKDY